MGEVLALVRSMWLLSTVQEPVFYVCFNNHLREMSEAFGKLNEMQPAVH